MRPSSKTTVYGFLSFVAVYTCLWSLIGVRFNLTRFETDDLAHRLLNNNLANTCSSAPTAILPPLSKVPTPNARILHPKDEDLEFPPLSCPQFEKP